jgi:hypothetical protein
LGKRSGQGFESVPEYSLHFALQFIGLLPREYASYYDGWVIKEMIELAVSWDDLDTIPDPCWVLTEDFGDTGELFGLKEEG